MPAGIYVRQKKDYGHRICKECGVSFSKKEKEKPYQFKRRLCCSRQCNARFVGRLYCTGKKAHNNQQVKRVCRQCGKSTMLAPSHAKRPFCDKYCMAKYFVLSQRGDGHWNWQGGITEKQARDSLYIGYKQWRRDVYCRDGLRCRKCGHGQHSLEAHHLKSRSEYPELILDVTNGLTVCRDCHKVIHYGE